MEIDTHGRKEHWPSPPPGGFPRYGYVRQMPEHLEGRAVSVQSFPDRLPLNLLDADFQLMRVEPMSRGAADPFVLYNPWGEIVAEWEVMPSFGELLSLGRAVL